MAWLLVLPLPSNFLVTISSAAKTLIENKTKINAIKFKKDFFISYSPRASEADSSSFVSNLLELINLDKVLVESRNNLIILGLSLPT